MSLAWRKVCAAIDCTVCSVFLTRWLSSSTSSDCIASARASRVARRTAKARPISSSTVPIAAVSMSWRHSGAVNVSSAMPAATVQPVMSERANAVSSGTPSSDTVGTLASGTLNISANSVGDARCPMVFSGFGHPGEIDAVLVEERERPVLVRALAFDDALEFGERRIEREVVDDFAVAEHRHGDRDDQLLGDRSGEQRRIGRPPGLEHLAGPDAGRAHRQHLTVARCGCRTPAGRHGRR